MTNPSSETSKTAILPPELEPFVIELLDQSIDAFGEDLRSVVLFGSAAEGRLRVTSDINLLFVLRSFKKEAADAIRETVRMAHTGARVAVMYLLEEELPQAAVDFAVKFEDIKRRHSILHGEDLLTGLTIPREAKKQRLKQILLNLEIRLRERYVMLSLREEQLTRVLAESIAPLRVAASVLLELQGKPFDSPKAALQTVTESLGGEGWGDILEKVSMAREGNPLPEGEADTTLFRFIELSDRLRAVTEELD